MVEINRSNLEQLKAKELRGIAEELNIDLGKLRKRTDIIDCIMQNVEVIVVDGVEQANPEFTSPDGQENMNINEEENTMGEKLMKENVAEELVARAEAVGVEVTEFTSVEELEVAVQEAETNTDLPETKEEKQVWEVNGEEVSKSAFVRHQFLELNKSRKEIAEEYDIPYRTVYGATVNMTNEAEPAGRGRSATNPKMLVTSTGAVLSSVTPEVAEGQEKVTLVTLDGEIALDENEVSVVFTTKEEVMAMYEATEVDRNTWIKEQVEAGEQRGDVAKKLGLSYGVVYGVTKDMEGTKQKHEIEYNGEVLSRSEYIRRRFAEGVKKADIAKELGVEYSVVWSATKKLKTEDEKLAEAIDKVAKFADAVEDKEAFDALIEQLKGAKIKVVEEKAEGTEGTDAAEGQNEEGQSESVYTEDQE